MAETTVELIKEWQTGAFFVFASTVVGVVAMAVFGNSFGPLVGVSALATASLATFAVRSYLRYGR